jgi:hypothetical protein
VQLKFSAAPSTTDAVPGAIDIADTVTAGAVTVTFADADEAIPVTDAVIVAYPGVSPVTTLLDTAATLGFEVVYTGEVHAVDVPFDNAAVQLKFSAAPSTTDAVPGAIDIDVTVVLGAVTVTSAVADNATPAAVAVIVVDPGMSPVKTLLDRDPTLGFEDA